MKYTNYFTWVKTSEHIPDFEFDFNGTLISNVVIIWDHALDKYNVAKLYKKDTNYWWTTIDEIGFPFSEIKYWMPISPPPVPDEE